MTSRFLNSFVGVNLGKSLLGSRAEITYSTLSISNLLSHCHYPVAPWVTRWSPTGCSRLYMARWYQVSATLNVETAPLLALLCKACRSAQPGFEPTGEIPWWENNVYGLSKWVFLLQESQEEVQDLIPASSYSQMQQCIGSESLQVLHSLDCNVTTTNNMMWDRSSTRGHTSNPYC